MVGTVDIGKTVKSSQREWKSLEDTMWKRFPVLLSRFQGVVCVRKMFLCVGVS